MLCIMKEPAQEGSFIFRLLAHGQTIFRDSLAYLGLAAQESTKATPSAKRRYDEADLGDATYVDSALPNSE